MTGAPPPVALIAGLGNPGSEYEQTRHNAGFWFVDELARRHDAGLRKEPKFQGRAGKVVVAGRDLWLLKPDTFMNRSGQSVAALAGFFKIPVEAILVVHDELDLPPGTVRIKRAGGHGGHNGLRSLIQHLGPEFLRLRLGIGHPGHKDQVVDYVLSRPSRDDRRAIEGAVDEAAAVVPLLLNGEFERAMRALHSD